MASLMMVTNPRKRRKAAPKRKRRTSLASVRTVSTRKYRRNPSPRLGSTMDTIKEGAIGAAGAVASEVLLSKLPLPANLQTGPAKTAVSALGAVGVGMLVGKFANKKLGKTMAQGGVTVALHSVIRGAVAGPMGLAGYYDDGMGYYGDDDFSMGYNSSAPTFEDFDEFDDSDFDY